MGFGGRGGSSSRGSGYQSRGGRGGYNSGGAGGDPTRPSAVIPLGTFVHASEGMMVCKGATADSAVPFFNACVFLENKQLVGRVDEILGPVNQMFFSVKPEQGVVATSFKAGDAVFVGNDKLLPLDRFLPKPKAITSGGVKKSTAPRSGGRGGFRGGARGSFRGGARGGGRGAPRGAMRGGFRGGRGGSFGRQ
jgi:H/ACA ribonucleoprotein complex subunit 1